MSTKQADSSPGANTEGVPLKATLLLSVVIPAFGDATQLRQLLSDLLLQDLAPDLYEIVVVDDGSPVAIEPQLQNMLQGRVALRCLRKANGGGPSARNYGAHQARGQVLLFLDQDIRIPANFLRTHVEAQGWVGRGALSAHYKNRLTSEEGPFPRWYLSICKTWEKEGNAGGTEVARGVYEVHPVLLTSINVSMHRETFEAAGGFPIYPISGVEDQALGLTLGRMRVKVFRTDLVQALHVESRASLEPFCRRQRIGMAGTVKMIRQFPEVFGKLEDHEQHRVNGPLRLWEDSLRQTARKLIKSLLVRPHVRRLALAFIARLEHAAPETPLLARAYRALLAAHIQQGWREGLRTESRAEVPPT